MAQYFFINHTIIPNSGQNTIALQNQLCEQQTIHIIQIVLHLVSISNTNPRPFKVPFKTQLITRKTSQRATNKYGYNKKIQAEINKHPTRSHMFNVVTKPKSC